jgi:hypothetical protein
MGLLNNLGVNLPQGSPINWGNIGLIVLLVVIFIVACIIAIIFVIKRIHAKQYIQKITFAKEVNGRIFLVGEDYAKELTIPYTSIKVFWLKQMKTYSPKLVYDIGKNSYLILIGKGGEWTNTDLRFGADGVIELNDTLKPSRDYANENLKELIKRNWEDKNKNWWKENAHFIFLIILGVIIITALIISGVQAKKTNIAMSGMAENFKIASENYANANDNLVNFLKEQFKNSGVIETTPGG